MKVLFIGGTGNISTSLSRLCISKGIDLYLLNRGITKKKIEGAKYINCDINDFNNASELLKNHKWDSVVNWIAFTENEVLRDFKLFHKSTKQYIFISSASCYQKPPVFPMITESTPLCNPFWEYSRNKIACEERLNEKYRETGFPITIVRPSHTYDTAIPVAIGGWTDYTIIDRIKKGKKVIIHGDGTSLWTLTHSKDFAKGFVGLIGNEQSIGHAFHITSDELLNWNQIYKIIADTVECELNYLHISSELICNLEPSLTGPLLGDKSASVLFDNSKIKRFVPEFCASIPFRDGIRETISWFESEKERMTIIEDINQMMDRIIQTYEKCF